MKRVVKDGYRCVGLAYNANDHYHTFSYTSTDCIQKIIDSNCKTIPQRSVIKHIIWLDPIREECTLEEATTVEIPKVGEFYRCNISHNVCKIICDRELECPKKRPSLNRFGILYSGHTLSSVRLDTLQQDFTKVASWEDET